MNTSGGTNAETAYMLGRYCGLRINECFGLKWKQIDTKRGTIRIEHQEQYQDGLIKLVPLKTRDARRTIYMCDKVKTHFESLEAQRKVFTPEQGTERLKPRKSITSACHKIVLIRCLKTSTRCKCR